MALASPTGPLTWPTTTGRYGRATCCARNAVPKMAKIRRTAGSPRTLRRAPNASSTVRPAGTTSGRTSREPSPTSSAVPIERPAETANTAGRPQCSPSTITPPSAGPTAKPIGPLTPKSASAVPSRTRGVESLMAPSMIPVLPSWKPMRSMLPASCHGSRDRATAAKTTASTIELRMMTALRLYLSAQTPHNGTSGMPTTKSNELNRPTKCRRSGSATPMSLR